jgi:hypothetical protein
MRKNSGYRITIGILLAIIIFQWLLIFNLKITKPKKITKIAPAVKARIAIVIDDWGYNLNNLDTLNAINYPLTMSILPNLNYTRHIAEFLHSRGFEIILHLPLEPHEKYRLEKDTIMTSFDEATIKSILAKDLTSVMYARGVSNHMGSSATEDLKTMQVIFKELKRRNLYFLDSFVSDKSVCSDLARKMGLGFVKRDIFLDNIEESGYIREQINKLKSRAKTRGFAVAIGHNRFVTLNVLKEEIPLLEKEGYKLVFVSELIK